MPSHSLGCGLAALWDPGLALGPRPYLRLEFPDPGYGERQALWASRLGQEATGLGDEGLQGLAGRFRLTQGQIADALAHAKTLAWTREPGAATLSSLDIDGACRAQSQHGLQALARKLRP